MSTRELIDAIANGEAAEVETTFNNIMAAKVSDKLDVLRTDMAQTMFQTPGEPEDENDFDPETEVTSEEQSEEEQETATEDNE